MKKKKQELEKRAEFKGSRLLKMKWYRDKDDPQAKQCIAELAVLLSHLRCDVQTSREGSDIGYSPSLPERLQHTAKYYSTLLKDMLFYMEGIL